MVNNSSIKIQLNTHVFVAIVGLLFSWPINPRTRLRNTHLVTEIIFLIELAILNMVDLIFQHVYLKLTGEPGWLKVVCLPSMNPRLCHDLLPIVLAIESLLSAHPCEAHVTEVFHLNLLISYTLRVDEVVCRLNLCMHIVARNNDPLKPLVRIYIVLCAPDFNIVLMLLPIDAEELTLFVFI